MKKLLLMLLYLYANTTFADCSLNESEAITKLINWIRENNNGSIENKFIDDPKFCRLTVSYNYLGKKHEVEYLAINNRENKADPIFYNDIKFVDLNWESNKTLRTKTLENEYPNRLILAKDGKHIIWNPSGFFEKSTKYMESEFSKGIKNGTEKTWHSNGKLKSESYYIDGELNGSELVWSESGSLLSEKKYKKGIIDSGNDQVLETNDVLTEKYFNNREKELVREKIKLENERKEQAEKEIKAQQAEELLKKDRIAKAKNKCADLGFAVNTDKNAKCVLELMR